MYVNDIKIQGSIWNKDKENLVSVWWLGEIKIGIDYFIEISEL